MRLKFKGKIKSHTLLTDVNPSDHHLQANYVTIIENGYTIPNGVYQRRIPLGSNGYKTARANLRGHVSIGVAGHCGTFAIGSDVAQQSVGISNSYSGYVYLGCFNRLHGDSYLSNAIFGNAIYLQDLFIDGSDVVLQFYNASPSNEALICYGTIVVK